MTSVKPPCGGVPAVDQQLAAGMANIFANAIGGSVQLAFWYHFAIILRRCSSSSVLMLALGWEGFSCMTSLDYYGNHLVRPIGILLPS